MKIKLTKKNPINGGEEEKKREINRREGEK